jgi:hypothetical protein
MMMSSRNGEAGCNEADVGLRPFVAHSEFYLIDHLN